MTYDELTKEQIDKLINDPVFMFNLELKYEAEMRILYADVDEHLRKLAETINGTATSTNR